MGAVVKGCWLAEGAHAGIMTAFRLGHLPVLCQGFPGHFPISDHGLHYPIQYVDLQSSAARPIMLCPALSDT